jgi:hypothetical protein
MKMTVFWDVATCSLVEIGRRFRVTYRPHDGGSRGGVGSPGHGVVSDTRGVLKMVAGSDKLQPWHLRILFFLPLTGSVS